MLYFATNGSSQSASLPARNQLYLAAAVIPARYPHLNKGVQKNETPQEFSCCKSTDAYRCRNRKCLWDHNRPIQMHHYYHRSSGWKTSYTTLIRSLILRSVKSRISFPATTISEIFRIKKPWKNLPSVRSSCFSMVFSLRYANFRRRVLISNARKSREMLWFSTISSSSFSSSIVQLQAFATGRDVDKTVWTAAFLDS